MCYGKKAVYLGKWIKIIVENSAVRAMMELEKRKHTEGLTKFMGVGREDLSSWYARKEEWKSGVKLAGGRDDAQSC